MRWVQTAERQQVQVRQGERQPTGGTVCVQHTYLDPQHEVIQKNSNKKKIQKYRHLFIPFVHYFLAKQLEHLEASGMSSVTCTLYKLFTNTPPLHGIQCTAPPRVPRSNYFISPNFQLLFVSLFSSLFIFSSLQFSNLISPQRERISLDS